MKIDKEQLAICGLGKGEKCCSYLGMGPNGFECLKHTEFRREIEWRREKEEIVAMGDNCEGLKEELSN